jgi:hypothetical protein
MGLFMGKIFVVGLQKTGTTSMADALKLLGYRTTGPNFIFRSDLDSMVHTRISETIEMYDAFQDNPWSVSYRYLDEACPGSKFILTVRDAESWLRSLKNHYRHRTLEPMMYYVFGKELIDPWNDELLLQFYKEHIRGVRDYFYGREDSLLELNVALEDPWLPICSFLGKDLPLVEFPHSNSSSKSSGTLITWRASVRRRVKILLRRNQFY